MIARELVEEIRGRVPVPVDDHDDGARRAVAEAHGPVLRAYGALGAGVATLADPELGAIVLEIENVRHGTGLRVAPRTRVWHPRSYAQRHNC